MEQASAANQSNQIKRELEFFGEKVLIVMEADGSYSVYADGKEIEFLPWALEKQKSMKSASDHE